MLPDELIREVERLRKDVDKLKTFDIPKVTDGLLYAPASKGVTNGDSHDHVGGDGAQISFDGLSNHPHLDIVTADTEIVNDNTEQAVYSFSIPGGTIGTANLLRFRMVASYLNNSGGNSNLTVKMKIGATAMMSAAVTGLVTNANRRAQWLELEIRGDGATNAQTAVSRYNHPIPAMRGAYNLYSDEYFGAFDSTGALTLSITIQHSVADANISYIMRQATLELLKAK